MNQSIVKNNNINNVPSSLGMDVEILKVPPIIRVKDVRFYFGIDRYTLWRLLANPRSGVKGYKKGKIWLIRTASVLRYIMKNSNEGNRN